MSDATPAPYTYNVTVVAGLSATNVPITTTYQVQGAFLDVKGEVYVITDSLGNAVAAVHVYGTVVTRNDAVTA